MLKRKRLPTISLKQTQTDFSPPIRRRNHSLGSRYQSQPQNPLERDAAASIKMKTLGQSYSKKNKLFLKSEKIQKARDLTKLCQEGVSQYIQLKNSVKKMKTFLDEEEKNDSGRSSKPSFTSPKLSIKLLNVPINFSFKGKCGFLPLEYSSKLRMKTEICPKNTIKLRRSNQVDHMRASALPAPLSPKKYNQLTLREIVESEDEVSDRLQLFQKIQSMKERLRVSIRPQRLQKQEEPLAGW